VIFINNREKKDDNLLAFIIGFVTTIFFFSAFAITFSIIHFIFKTIIGFNTILGTLGILGLLGGVLFLEVHKSN